MTVILYGSQTLILTYTLLVDPYSKVLDQCCLSRAILVGQNIIWQYLLLNLSVFLC